MSCTRNIILCFSILCNALSAGGVFTFPLLAPALISRLKLTQPQITTIVLAGMAGQYPFSSIVGKVLDKYGSGVTSLAAAIAFSVGYGFSTWEIVSTPDNISHTNDASAQRLTFYFAILGLGTVLSYFSFVFAASKSFPSYISIASGTSMALFGLSPLFLSSLASFFFTNSDGSLQIVPFLSFMAALAGIANLIGSITLNVNPAPLSDNKSLSPPDSDDVSPDETTSLLPRLQDRDQDDSSVLALLQDPYFWVLCLYLMITLGTCEMIFSNVGTMVLSLPSSTPHLTMATDNVASAQVKILSISNTLSRLLIGPLADFLSPSIAYLPTGALRKHRISRIAFLSFAALVLSASCGWMQAGVQTQQDVWVLSIGTGLVYGCIFTVLPSITCSVWGMSNLARNFGIVTYAPFVGTTVYSYLYALLATRHTGHNSVCQGRVCWELTFWICGGTSLIAFALSVFLWRSWKGKL